MKFQFVTVLNKKETFFETEIAKLVLTFRLKNEKSSFYFIKKLYIKDITV